MEPGLGQVLVNSPVYMGGIPDEIQNRFKELGLEQGFGGCMKDVKFTRGAVVNLASVSSSAVRVNLDGCLSTDRAVNCRGNDSILVYRGKERSVYENGLQPFTEYLYRIIASNEGGSVSSAWNRGRTRESVPQNVPTPSGVHGINGYSVEVTWDKPAEVKGVIEKYILKAVREDGSTFSTVSTEITNTTTFTGILTGLQPFAKYAVTLTACTLAGCTESSHALNISTPQEDRFGRAYSCVDGMVVVCEGEEEWKEKCQPGEKRMGSGVREEEMSGKRVWQTPAEVNGNLQRYILYIANDEENVTVWNVIYNSTVLSRDYTIRHLSPGTEYFFKLAACTGGGCTVSEPASAITTESTPEGVLAPDAQSYSSDSFNVSWTKPEYPNAHVVEARTIEDVPEGKIEVFVINSGSRGVQVKWYPPHEPNGGIIYAVLFTGIFYADEGISILVCC
uniref:Usherin-like n=1 Tax=Pogona vitticeps TaxID=103695 RepID=A0ABM5FGW6_9SAUR